MSAHDDPLASVRAAAAALRDGTTSPTELVDALIERIERLDGELATYVTVVADEARAGARRAEVELAVGRDVGPLHGIPIVHKDNCMTAGVRTTSHSRTMLEHVPEEDATFVRKLRDAGAILLGKTNTTEFACGDMHLFGMTRNPWDLSRYAGGSSGGSAAAIASGLAIAATGTDTGGSIRAPSSLCGVVGVKPTYGRVSRRGVVPLSWTMDHAGPIARTVADAALLLWAMAGADPEDPTSSRAAVPRYHERLHVDPSAVTIGRPDGHYVEGLAPDVERAVEDALVVLQDLGFRVVPVDLPDAGSLAEVGSILVMAEAYAVHADRLRTRGREYGPRARQRIAAGAFYASADYQEALQLREHWRRIVAAAFEKVDAIVTPTLPMTAFSLDRQRAGPPDTSWGTRQANLAGNPAMTIPCGFDGRGLPIGLQIQARPFEEATMFRIGHAYEQATEWHLRRPPVVEGASR
jgi:aspartyl-tRNA(Asn)/glutamyl-tRNA(Gln) amidotransferase subunit A